MFLEVIQFPNLDPAAYTLHFDPLNQGWGPFPLRWYALAYIAGLLLGWRWMALLIRRERLWAPGKAPLSVAQADDYLFWVTLGVILGGRLGYILFYMLPSAAERARIAADPATLLRIWEGGMAFHGGLLGVLVASYWFTRQLHLDEARLKGLLADKAKPARPAEGGPFVRMANIGWVTKSQAAEAEAKARTVKIDLLALGDLAAAATPIGLFFGRIANFVNGELWGRVTDAPWGVVFCNEAIRAAHYGACPAGTEPRHPSQLYEAGLEGLALFTIINVAIFRFDALKRPGLNVGLFLLCYGLFRFCLEFVREPDAHMPEALRSFLTMGMTLSAPMVVIGAWLVWRALKTASARTA